MKYVQMIVDVADGNTDLAKTKRGRLKVTKHRGAKVALVKGAVLPMDDQGADKYVARGLGEIVTQAEYEAFVAKPAA